MLEESKEDLKRPATVMHQREETRRDIRQFFSVWRLEVALANVEIGWILKMTLLPTSSGYFTNGGKPDIIAIGLIITMPLIETDWKLIEIVKER